MPHTALLFSSNAVCGTVPLWSEPSGTAAEAGEGILGRLRRARKSRLVDGVGPIVSYVESRFGPATTDDVLRPFESSFLRLAEFPRAGHLREDRTDDPAIRFWSVPPGLIAYRADRDPIEVLFIERGEIDSEWLLGDDARRWGS